VDAAVKLGEELGTARAFMRGFKAGVLAERRDAEGREAARWLAEINAGADVPLASRRALRLVEDER
jgi:hypothetical protein